MLPIRIEATNPSSIGGYKNTPFTSPIPARKHTKPIKGSYQNWIKKELTEGKHIVLEDTNLTEEELVAATVSSILQNNKYPYIAYWVNNEEDTAEELASNEEELRLFVEAHLDSVVRGTNEDPVSPELLVKEWSEDLKKLNSSLKSQYEEEKR